MGESVRIAGVLATVQASGVLCKPFVLLQTKALQNSKYVKTFSQGHS